MAHPDTALPPVIVILGPTASGKSALALAVAKQIGGEIISADSRQIYRELDIGAADKLTTPETAESIHSLIPGSEFHLLAGAGHISNMEQPEAFSKALLDHVKEVSRA